MKGKPLRMRYGRCAEVLGARGRRAECPASVLAPGHAIEDRPSVAILAPRARRESSAQRGHQHREAEAALA